MSPAVSTDRSAFTIVELIIVMAIFTIVFATTAPFLMKFQHSQTVGSEAENIFQALRKAQHRALTGERNSSWGVALVVGPPAQYILFAGDSYASRITTYDDVRTLATEYALSPATSFVFRRGTGIPQSIGTITITQAAGASRQVLIGSGGMLSLLAGTP